MKVPSAWMTYGARSVRLNSIVHVYAQDGGDEEDEDKMEEQTDDRKQPRLQSALSNTSATTMVF